MLSWNNKGNPDSFNKVPRSLPETVWRSLGNKNETQIVFNGCFQRNPISVAKSLKRPSAPQIKRKVTWPKGLSCYDYQAKYKNKIQRSKSLDDFPIKQC